MCGGVRGGGQGLTSRLAERPQLLLLREGGGGASSEAGLGGNEGESTRFRVEVRLANSSLEHLEGAPGGAGCFAFIHLRFSLLYGGGWILLLPWGLGGSSLTEEPQQ